VNELHKSLVLPRGNLLPASLTNTSATSRMPLWRKLSESCRPLLSKPDTDLRIWRDALREAFGPNGQLIVDLVLTEHIIGEQPPVPVLPPQDAQRRFHLVFRRFIGVFARRSIRWRCFSTTCNGSMQRRSS